MSKRWNFQDEDYTDEENNEWAGFFSGSTKRTHVGKLPGKRRGGRDEFELRRSARRAKRDWQRAY